MKLIYPPDVSSYTVTPDAQVTDVKLAGGASRYRLDLLDASTTVDVQWTCNDALFQYLVIFHRYNVAQGGAQFQIDLCLENTKPVAYNARFVPGQWKIAASTSQIYIITAQLEVEPVEYTNEQENEDLTWLLLQETYGPQAMNIIDTAVNLYWFTLPAAPDLVGVEANKLYDLTVNEEWPS